MMKRTRPLVTLHSGGLDTPANSRLYLERAAQMRPDICEVDIRACADGELVLSHDPEPPEGPPYARMTLAEARFRNPGLVTLREALAFFREHRMCMNLDLKDPSVVRPAGELIREIREGGPFLFSGCGSREAAELLEVFPSARVLFNAPSWDRNRYPEYSRYATEIIRESQELGCYGVNLCYRDLQPELVGYSRYHQVPLFIWTVNDPEEMEILMRLGVYSITSDRIDLLRSVMEASFAGPDRLEDTLWLQNGSLRT